ncbi:uncharacterized protein [Drosophila kikkawai]|uniref:Essential protein Yae1 N-terminal domain-containing protein n=1 Tax=Drosophila kikkawai TaxID=30033 RepID=A0A6P4JNP6_DROKI|nr:uncharacterized protein LOC108084586 [Drosophila kikkawai]
MSAPESSDEETDFKVVSSTNYQRVQDKVAKISYADGIADGREKVFQDSFDQGYEDGLKTALKLAKLSAFYETLQEHAEREAYQILKLADPAAKEHFKYLEHQGAPLSVVREKQRTYLDDLIGQCAQALPATTNLFASGSSS